MNIKVPPASSYIYNNIEQYRAIMQSLDYKEEYNRNNLKYSKGSEEYHISLDEIKNHKTDLADDLLKDKKKYSLESLSQVFDFKLATSEYNSYKLQLEKNNNVSLFKWGEDKEGKDKSKVAITIIDHKNKTCFTEKEFYDYALDNGYTLDGKGTQSMEHNTNNIFHKRNNKQPSQQESAEIFIPRKILDHELTLEDKAKIQSGRSIVIQNKGASNISIQIDKDANTIRFSSAKEIKLNSEIGGHKLTELEKIILSSGKFTSPILLQDGLKGQYFVAEVSLSEDKHTLEYKNLKTLSKEEALILKKEYEVSKDLFFENPQKNINMDDNKLNKTVNILDGKILEAIKNEEYPFVLNQVKGGYKPSAELIKELNELSLTPDKKVGVERLLGIETTKTNGAKISIENDKELEKKKSNIKDKTLQATNGLFQNM